MLLLLQSDLCCFWNDECDVCVYQQNMLDSELIAPPAGKVKKENFPI